MKPMNSTQPPKIAVNFANSVFLMGLAFSVLVIIFAVNRLYAPLHPTDSINISSGEIYIFFCIIGVVSAILFGFGLTLKDDLKVNLSILIFVLASLTFLTEFLLAILAINEVFTPKTNAVARTTTKRPSNDHGTKLEFIEGLRSDGVDAVPNVAPYVHLNSKAGVIFPLGGISNKTTVSCTTRKDGSWQTWKSDEHGFNNPIGLYKKKNVEIVLIGDSYTEGLCVEQEENIGAVLRKSGLNTISLGKLGDGPLLEYATLMEYAKPLRPKLIFWIYFEGNDMEDLQSELHSTILKRYFDDEDFTQSLNTKQNEIDSYLEKFVKQNKQAIKFYKPSLSIFNYKGVTLRNVVTLSKLRQRLKLNPLYFNLRKFKPILEKAKRVVSEWDGRLYFVYLPASWNYSFTHDDIKDIVNELDIPFIDIYKDTILPHPNHRIVFGGHYGAEGYGLVAETIISRLKKDGFPVKR
jgi:hypothetical protein